MLTFLSCLNFIVQHINLNLKENLWTLLGDVSLYGQLAKAFGSQVEVHATFSVLFHSHNKNLILRS